MPATSRPFAVAALALGLTLFALALPAFEGVDEAFHLGRARDFASRPLAAAWAGDLLDEGLLASLRASPCGPDLQRTVGCPPFGGVSAWWNALEPVGPGPAAPQEPADARSRPVDPVGNYQSHQPPLYYLGAGALLRALDALAGPLAPRHQLLVLRLVAVVLVLGSVVCSLRWLDLPHGWLLVALLLLPGAVEALVRVTNDTAVFAWAAGFLLFLRPRPDGGRPHALGVAAASALGPLLKLTAAPILVYAAGDRLRRGDRRGALAIALGGVAILPLQLARGWAWGGTLELAAPSRGPYDSWLEPVAGIVHSTYTFLKTALWLGGWSVVKPPVWVLSAAVVVLLVGLARARPRRDRSLLLPHLAAGLVAAAGFVAFALGKERLFGVWGGVGGWYLWTWSPWLVLAWQECTRPRERRWSRSDRLWIGGVLVFLCAVGLAWLRALDAVYGG